MESSMMLGDQEVSLLPNESQIGETFVVVFYNSPKKFYAIYSGVNEFDVHMRQGYGPNYREEWHKFTVKPIKAFYKL